MYDAHCHPTDSMDNINLINNMTVSKLVCMSTRIDDQQLVEDCIHSFGNKIIPCFGNDVLY